MSSLTILLLKKLNFIIIACSKKPRRGAEDSQDPRLWAAALPSISHFPLQTSAFNK